MSTPTERAEVTAYILDFAAKAAHGNAHAQAYLHSIMRATRLADDLADGDLGDPAQRAEAAAELVDCLLIQIPTNPFFIASADLLTGVHLACLNAWRQSNRWWNGARGRHEYANVWRDQILDVFAVVARLTGHPDPLGLNETVRECLKKNEPAPPPRPVEDRTAGAFDHFREWQEKVERNLDKALENVLKPAPPLEVRPDADGRVEAYLCGNCGRMHKLRRFCATCGRQTSAIRVSKQEFDGLK